MDSINYSWALYCPLLRVCCRHITAIFFNWKLSGTPRIKPGRLGYLRQRYLWATVQMTLIPFNALAYNFSQSSLFLPLIDGVARNSFSMLLEIYNYVISKPRPHSSIPTPLNNIAIAKCQESNPRLLCHIDRFMLLSIEFPLSSKNCA